MDQGPKCQTSNRTKASQHWIWQWFLGYDTKSTGNNDIDKHRKIGLHENYNFVHQKGFAGGTSGKEPTCQCRRHKRSGLERSPGRGAWQPIPVFLPGESHGQRSLVGYSPPGRKESNTTEQLSMHACASENCPQNKKVTHRIWENICKLYIL